MSDYGSPFQGTPAAPSTEQLAERAQRFSAFRGVPPDRLAILPKGASPDQQLAVLQRLGAPNDAAAYDFSKTGVPENMHAWAAETAKKAGLLPHQAHHIAERFAASMDPEAAAQAEQEAANVEMSALQSEWKGDYLARVELARRAMRFAERQGHNANEVLNYIEAAAGPAAAIKVAYQWGQTLTEGAFVDGEASTQPQASMTNRWYPD